MLGIDLKKLKPSFGSGGKKKLPVDQKDCDNVTEDNLKTESDHAEAVTNPKDSKREDKDDFDASYEEESETSSDNIQNDNDDENAQDILANLEIPDFNLSVVFDQVAAAEQDIGDNGVDYTKRLRREEVYSKRYHPSKEEREELEDLANRLGVSSSAFRLTSSASTLYELLFGNHSIIMKMGPISSKDEICDLYLLTDGFILAYQSVSVFNPLGSRYEGCQLWADVEFLDIARAGTLHIQMMSGESYELFAVANGENVQTWLVDIERVVIPSIMHNSQNHSKRTRMFGWQHTVIRHPGLTAAVTGDLRLMGNPRNLNELDLYNHSAPLHYAMQLDPCNAEMVEVLLRLGADPNFPDGEGRSAMYFAKRNKLDDVESILKEHGGNPSKLAEIEVRGELFGVVERAQRNVEKRREEEQAIKDQKAAEAVVKAESAQSQMSRNMAAMLERGQKIEEMDDKARQLNEQAKAYGDMAAQLKNNLKNKKWYQL